MNLQSLPEMAPSVEDEDFEDKYPLFIPIFNGTGYVRYSAHDVLVGDFYQDWAERMPKEIEPTFRKRVCNGTIHNTQNVVISMFEFNRYSLPILVNGDELCEYLDRDSSYESELAVILTSCWPEFGEQVSDFGDVLDLYGFWHNGDKSTYQLVRDGIDAAVCDISNNAHSIITTKASAMSIGNEGASENRKKLEFNNQQTVLKKFFREEMKFIELPRNFGSDGWMWRPNPHKSQCINSPMKF